MVISVFVISVYRFTFLSCSVMFVQFKWQPLPKSIAINNLYYRSTFMLASAAARSTCLFLKAQQLSLTFLTCPNPGLPFIFIF